MRVSRGRQIDNLSKAIDTEELLALLAHQWTAAARLDSLGELSEARCLHDINEELAASAPAGSKAWVRAAPILIVQHDDSCDVDI